MALPALLFDGEYPLTSKNILPILQLLESNVLSKAIILLVKQSFFRTFRRCLSGGRVLQDKNKSAIIIGLKSLFPLTKGLMVFKISLKGLVILSIELGRESAYSSEGGWSVYPGRKASGQPGGSKRGSGQAEKISQDSGLPGDQGGDHRRRGETSTVYSGTQS